MTAKADTLLGPFRILGPITGARGSQGSVFRAVCENAEMPGLRTGDVVAVKVMAGDDNGEALRRLQERIRLIQKTGHANVVRYYGAFLVAGEFNSQIAVVMELLEGEPLSERIAKSRGGLDADEALRVVDHALSGLAATEAAGIVHRDIKPSNIFLCRDGGVKIVDFGVATQVNVQSSTASGRFAGTFDYMAPEFANPSFHGTPRSDVFSMAVVLHETLTGQLPYTQLKEKGQSADFAYLSRWSQRQEGLCAIHIKSSIGRVLDGADAVLARALDENPEKRYAGAEDFRAALGQVRFRDLKGETDAYRFLKMIGKGGFGEVYKARILGTGKPVAVKRLLNPAYGDRFRREKNVMRRLDDPSFVRFVDFIDIDRAGGTDAFLVMAYLPEMPGSSLRDAIRRAAGRPLPFADVIMAFAIYARALGKMHGLGIYHRDIKPSNLYFREGHPEQSVVMDLGIARDQNGTQTAGQVPGTLDYMPPEVVGAESRGDAGMDFYALGLCLYEALTGSSAYPRLPSGPSAFAAFYARVSSKERPKFDARPVVDNPRLLDLLRSLTELNLKRRLTNAAEVVRRLAEILSETGERPFAVVPSPPSPPPVPQDDAPTPATNPTAAPGGDTDFEDARESHASSALSFWRIPGLRRLVAGIAVVTLLAVAWSPMCELVGLGRKTAMDWIDRKKAESRQAEVEQAEKARIAAENAERNRCRSAAAELVTRINDDQVSDEALKIERSDWLSVWQTNALVAAEVAQATDDFKAAFERRAQRTVERENRRVVDLYRDEGRVLVSLWNGHGNATNACAAKTAEWEARWNGEKRLPKDVRNEIARSVDAAREERFRWEGEQVASRVEFQKRMKLHREFAETCAAAAAEVIAAYAAPDVELAEADIRRSRWEVEWSKYGEASYLAPLQVGEGFYAPARRRIEQARADRLKTVSSQSYLDEVGRRLDAVVNVTVDHAAADYVGRWRSRLVSVEVEVRKARDAGRITTAKADEFQKRVEDMKGWTVGIVDNRSEMTAEFGGVKIEPYTWKAVVFRGPFPEWAAISGGDEAEPIRVLRERFDGEIFKVFRFEAQGKCVANVPEFGAEVTCIIGGFSRKPGKVLLRRGRHYVCYRNGRETFPGIRDFIDKEYPFDTSVGEAVDVPAPTGAWAETSEFRARKQQEGARGQADGIVRECRENLKPEPAETRRARLEKVHALLSDWKTPSALRVLGAGIERDLRREYDAERALFRGYVKNESRVRLEVDANGVKTALAPGERKLVTFTSWDGRGRVEIDGVANLPLPSDRAQFDGREFVVTEEKLAKLPVRVALPELSGGETCEVDGRELKPVDELPPGDYEAVYRKSGERRKVPFRVEIATPLTLPR